MKFQNLSRHFAVLTIILAVVVTHSTVKNCRLTKQLFLLLSSLHVHVVTYIHKSLMVMRDKCKSTTMTCCGQTTCDIVVADITIPQLQYNHSSGCKHKVAGKQFRRDLLQNP